MSNHRSRSRWIGYGRRGRSAPSIAMGDDSFLDAAMKVFIRRFLDDSFLHFARRNRQEATSILNQLGESLVSLSDRMELAHALLGEYKFSDFEVRLRRSIDVDDEEMEIKKSKAVLAECEKQKIAEALKDEAGKILFPLCKTGSLQKNQVWLDVLVRLALGEDERGRREPSVEVHGSEFEQRLEDLVCSLRLSQTERELVVAMYCLKVSSDLPLVASFNEIFCEYNFKTQMHRFLGISQSESSKILSANGTLRRCNIISSSAFDSQFELDDRIAEFLAGFKGQELLPAVLEKIDTSSMECDLNDVSIPPRQVDVMMRVLRRDEPAQLLLYGLPGHGKTTLALAAAKNSGREIYQIADRDEMKPGEIVSAIKRADVLLRGRGDVILMIDEADRILCTESAWTMFGERSDKAWLNNLMDSSDGPAMIWITNQIDGIALSTNRRFDLSIEFGPINTKQRYAVWKKILDRRPDFFGDIPDHVIWELSSRYQLPPSVIKDTAEKVASLTTASTQDTILLFKQFLESATDLSGRTQGRAKSDVFLPCENYSLDGLNLDTDPEAVIESVKNVFEFIESNQDDRRGAHLNILLVGTPGTGKTELVKHIAKAVDRDVIVKKASDLLNPYVGMNERNVAQAFREAETANAILFIDEVDSLIHDRAAAVRSWETSLTNELLQQMEQFRGVLICATNNDQALDGAAFRRFSIKVNFRYLKEEGRRVFWRKFFPKVEMTAHVEKRLGSMNCLAPGDFHAVANRFRFLNGVNPSADEILNALDSEVAFKVRKVGREIGYR